MISNIEIENNNSDSEYEFDDKLEKKIFPVYNENNFYITKEIIQSILPKR